MAVVENGVQTADVTGLVRIEQGHRDAARVERSEEGDEIVEVLRAQDRDPVTGLGDLLQAGADGLVAGTEVGPVQVALDTVALGREVDESVGEFVPTNLRPSFDVLDQVPVVGELDQSVLMNGLWKAISTPITWDRSQAPKIVPGPRLPALQPRRTLLDFP